MKKMQILVAGCLFLFAFSVVVASASAVTFLLAEWLINNVPVTGILLVETAGEVELISLNGAGLGVKSEVLCSGIGVGWIGEDGLTFGSELLTLSKELISNTELVGLALSCTNIKECTNPTVWPDGVPGEGLAVLIEETGFTGFAGLAFSVGYYVECTSILGKISELCSAAEGVAQLTNEANGTVDGEGSDAFQLLAGLTLGTCTAGGAESAEARGLGIGTPDAGTLEISSTG
ncbi:MAG TPA: hypothetical protein VHU13_07065 [Solirubrobacteraceae bacterium]|jgi:hypothetical protein|nr:hypothetical protein [Solirubrobacteraceae bacterium]